MMLKSDMQHQFWVTKKAVQRKLGSKEDHCVVSSDIELDLKLNLFDSIAETTQSLYRVLDMYQERMTSLAMEETQLGKFLKEHGKTTQLSGSGKRMSTAGKAISYSGQQRMTLRSPLVRLYSELDTFRSRAVADTQATINAMERDRTEYRASLSWMKSITLDPENDRGLEKFRKAQQTVRTSKDRFDQKSLDCLEKIDLLAAARCNMFSHVLVAYQKAMEVFAHKTYETFKIASKILENEPHYAFSILRDLTQAEKEPKGDEGEGTSGAGEKQQVVELREGAIDEDQLLFFQDDYKDVEQTPVVSSETANKEADEGKVAVLADEPRELEIGDLINVGAEKNTTKSQSSILDALDDTDAFLLDQPHVQPTGEAGNLKMDLSIFDDIGGSSMGTASSDVIDPLLDLLGDGPTDKNTLPGMGSSSNTGTSVLSALSNKISSSTKKQQQNMNGKSKSAGKDMSSWFKLFSELDPLANPDAMSKQIDAANSHSA